MNNVIGGVTIYRKGDAAEVVLMHYAPYYDARGGYKGNGCWGDLETVPLDRFATDGLAIVRASYAAFAKRRRNYDDLNDKQGMDFWTPAQRKRFEREYADVGASERENGDIWLDPTKPHVLGYSGMSDEEDRIIVPANATSAEFFASVLEALKRCR
jgi:hypothetical protein